MTNMPGAVQRRISHNYTARRRARTLGTVVHVTASVTARSQFGWFNNPAANASSHLHVDVYGVIEQYVDLDFIAWCQRSGNAEYVSIETQGGADGEWTPAQAASILKCLAWLSDHYNYPMVDMLYSLPGRRGVGLHRYGCDPYRVSGGMSWGPRGKVCPGDDRVRQFKRSGFLSGAPAEPAWKGAMGWPVLRQGDKGKPVEELQVSLLLLGYDVGEAGADSDFGPATHGAVVKLQRAHGLEPDGVVGKNTQNVIQAALTRLQEEDMLIIRRASDGATFIVLGGKGAQIANTSDMKEFQDAGANLVNLSDKGYSIAQKRYLNS